MNITTKKNIQREKGCGNMCDVYTESRVLVVPPVAASVSAEQQKKIPITVDACDKYEKKSYLDFFRLLVMRILTLWVRFKKRVLASFPSHWRNRRVKGKELQCLKTNSFFVDGVSKICRQIRVGAASWPALDVIVRFNFQWFGCVKLLDYFWLNIRNARAVRNRNTLVAMQLFAAMEERYHTQGQVVLTSIACGSFEAVVTALRLFVQKHGASSVQVFLIDQDKGAVEHMKQRVQQERLQATCRVERVMFLKWTNVLNLVQKYNLAPPNVVEMVGLFDHLSSDQIVQLSQTVRQALPEDGFFFTGHVAPNEEVPFMETVLEWFMFYRSPQELAELLQQAGWGNSEKTSCHIIGEPEQIHFVAACQKHLP